MNEATAREGLALDLLRRFVRDHDCETESGPCGCVLCKEAAKIQTEPAAREVARRLENAETIEGNARMFFAGVQSTLAAAFDYVAEKKGIRPRPKIDGDGDSAWPEILRRLWMERQITLSQARPAIGSSGANEEPMAPPPERRIAGYTTGPTGYLALVFENAPARAGGAEAALERVTAAAERVKDTIREAREVLFTPPPAGEEPSDA